MFKYFLEPFFSKNEKLTKMQKYKRNTHDFLQGGAATKGTREKCEAVNKRGEELIR